MAHVHGGELAGSQRRDGGDADGKILRLGPMGETAAEDAIGLFDIQFEVYPTEGRSSGPILLEHEAIPA